MRLKLLIFALLGFAGTLMVPAIGAQTVEDAANVEVETAPVRLDGRTLFRVRGTTSRPAAARAEYIEQRIREAADDPAVTAESLVVATEPLGLSIRAGSHLLVYVSEADAQVESVTAPVLAEFHRRQIAESIGR
jgi:hypothetical protein